jgi:hypothetical protein
MARKISSSFSGKHSSLEEIEEYYFDSESALNCYYNFSNVCNMPKFVGYTKKEINNELKSRKEWLDRMCAFEILAMIEARLYIDYLVRSQKKKKDVLSQAFHNIYQKKLDKASLKDDLIKTWKEICPQHKTRLDDLGRALDYRNWLAHGRYWTPTKKPHVLKYDYLGIYMLALDILNDMNLREN